MSIDLQECTVLRGLNQAAVGTGRGTARRAKTARDDPRTRRPAPRPGVATRSRRDRSACRNGAGTIAPSPRPMMTSPRPKGFLVVLGFAIALSAWSAPVQVAGGEIDRPQRTQRAGESLTARFKEEEVTPVLEVLREYAKTRHPALLRQLDSIELVVPEQRGFDANATAYRWGRSDIVTINLVLLLDFTALAELVAVSSTNHPAAESLYHKIIAYYEDFLKNVRPRGMGVEPWLIYSRLRNSLSDALHVESIGEIGKIVHRDIVAWAVLHEISHHILGHTVINSNSLSLSDGRKLELDADVSSFRLLNDLGLSLTNLKSFFGLRARMEPMLTKHGYEPQEDTSDHPSWATRLRALESYMEKNPPPKTPWIAFGSDKFVNDERLAGTYKLSTLHHIFPTEPAAWGNLGFGASQYLSPIAVSFENGQAHLYWRSDVFLSHLVIENPYGYTSRSTDTITSVRDGERYTAHDIETRDSVFRWRPGGSVGGVSLSEFQSAPPKDVMLRNARSIVQDPTILHEMERLIAELVKSDGAAFLDYMKGTITEGQYLNALQLSYRRMAKDLRALMGEDHSARFLSVILDSPYYKARGIRREQLGLPR